MRPIPVRGSLLLKFDEAGHVYSVEFKGVGAKRFWEALSKRSSSTPPSPAPPTEEKAPTPNRREG